MAGAQNDMDSENTSINITPLVDIMLVLLIIFMVTANMQQKKTIDVQLPKAETGQEVAMKGEPLAFSIDKESQYYLNGQKITLEEVDQKIKSIKESGSKIQISIAADAASSHGTVMKLIDTVRKYEIFDFSLDVETGK